MKVINYRRDASLAFDWKREKEPAYVRQRLPRIALTLHGAVRCEIARLCATCSRPLSERCEHAEGV
jgi:hypothetical protein